MTDKIIDINKDTPQDTPQDTTICPFIGAVSESVPAEMPNPNNKLEKVSVFLQQGRYMVCVKNNCPLWEHNDGDGYCSRVELIKSRLSDYDNDEQGESNDN